MLSVGMLCCLLFREARSDFLQCINSSRRGLHSKVPSVMLWQTKLWERKEETVCILACGCFCSNNVFIDKSGENLMSAFLKSELNSPVDSETLRRFSV